MTELDLYKFIYGEDSDVVEVRWESDMLLIWLDAWELHRFADMIRREDADDGGIDCKLQTSSGRAVVVFDLVPVCKEYGIDPENIRSRKEDDIWNQT